jgi:hypothetical protein
MNSLLLLRRRGVRDGARVKNFPTLPRTERTYARIVARFYGLDWEELPHTITSSISVFFFFEKFLDYM